MQTNFGGDLTIAGVPVGRELQSAKSKNSGDGSCMVIVATNAPVTYRNLKRLAKRATFGIAKTGGNCANGSGEYVIAFCTHPDLKIDYNGDTSVTLQNIELRNDHMTPLFEAAIEATEEAIYNSLFSARTITGKDGYTVEALPAEEILHILRRYNRIDH